LVVGVTYQIKFDKGTSKTNQPPRRWEDGENQIKLRVT